MLVVPGRAAVAVQLKDFRSIVDQLEGGARAIYITDAAGIYRFMAITVGQKIWKKDNGQWVMPFRSVLPVSLYAHLSVDDLPDLAGEAEGVLKKQPDVKEVPIVNARGEVVGLACSVENWQKEKTSDISSDDKWLDKKIYISSLKNPLLRKLYHDFHGCLDMVPLSQDNWQSVLSGESDGVLAYETDIFPNCPKAEVGRLYKLLCSHFRDR